MFLASIHQAFRLWSLMFRFISPVCSFWHCKYRCSRASLSTVLRVVYDIVWFAVQGKRCLPALNFGVLTLIVPPAPCCGLHCFYFLCFQIRF